MSKLKKYAITFATDDTWNSVDTMLVKSATNPIDMPISKIKGFFMLYGLPEWEAEIVANDTEMWFVRNCEDTDVYDLGEEKK